MSAKGFLLLVITIIVIGGSIGGAFSGGLALGRSQGSDAAPETALLQQRLGGGQPSADGFARGGFPGGQLSGVTSGGQGSTSAGESQTAQNAPSGENQGSIPGEGDQASEDGFSGFRGGDFGGRGGFGGILGGTVGAVDGNVFTVTTDSGEATVTLGEDTNIQVYEVGTVDDLSSGDRVLVVLSADVEAGEPVIATSVIVNAPTQGGFFRRGGFGGRPRGP